MKLSDVKKKMGDDIIFYGIYDIHHLLKANFKDYDMIFLDKGHYLITNKADCRYHYTFLIKDIYINPVNAFNNWLKKKRR